MASDNQVTLEINVDAKDAQKAIDQFGAGAVKSIKKVEKSAEGFGESIKSVGASLTAPFLPLIAIIGTVTAAFRSVSGAIEEAAKDSLQLKQIDSALRSTGQGGQEAVAAIVEYADAIKDTTGLSDDLVKSSFLTAKSFGISTEEAKKLTNAAIDLATATGIDVDTAVRQLGGTIDGSIGKIGNLGAEFRNLSTDQLKNGAAIDLVASKYKGAAESAFGTFAGSTSALSNALDDLSKAFGKAITENETLISGIRILTGALNKAAVLFTRPVAEYQKTLDAQAAKKFIDQIELVGNKSEIAAPKVKSLVESLAGINQSTIQSFQTFGESLNKVTIEVEKSTGLTGKAAEEARKKFDDLLKTVVNAGDSEIDIAAKVRLERLKILEQSIKDRVGTEQEYAVTRSKIEKDFSKVASEVQKKYIDEIEKNADRAIQAAEREAAGVKKAAEDARTHIEKIAASPIDFVINAEFMSTSAQEWGATVAGILNYALEGKSGALKLITSTVASVVDRFLPGLGGVIGSILGKLAGGKESAKEFVKEFITAIPELIQAIVEAIPGIVEGIIEVLSRPSFWIAVGKAIFSLDLRVIIFNIIRSAIFAGVKAFGPEFAAGFNKGVTQITDGINAAFTKFFADLGPALLNAFNGLVAAIGEAIARAFSKITAIFTGIVDAFRSLFQPLIDAINELKKVVEKIAGLGGKGGGDGWISEAGKALGFKKGGVVYAADGFSPRGTDTVPAMLTPGEMVIPTDLVGQLASFLSTQNGGGTSNSDAILMSILQAVQQPINVNSSVKVNQSAFADIMLQLNRQNARTAA